MELNVGMFSLKSLSCLLQHCTPVECANFLKLHALGTQIACVKHANAHGVLHLCVECVYIIRKKSAVTHDEYIVRQTDRLSSLNCCYIVSDQN